MWFSSEKAHIKKYIVVEWSKLASDLTVKELGFTG